MTNGHTAETPSTREFAGFYAPILSGLRAFGISLRASVPCGSIWWSGCVAWRGRRPAADTDGEPWCTCRFRGTSGGGNGGDRTFCPQNVSNIRPSKCFETVGRDILSSLCPRTFGRANCDIRRCCSEGWGMRRALVHLRPTPAVGLEQRPRHSERCTLRRRQGGEDRTFSPHNVSEHSVFGMFSQDSA